MSCLRAILVVLAFTGGVAAPLQGLVVESEVDTLSFALDVEVVDDRAYVVGNPNSRLEILDVSETGRPVSLGSGRLGTGGEDVEIAGDLAYVASSGFLILDVSDPSNIETLGEFNLPEGERGRPRDIELAGHLAFVAGTADWGVRILDVSDARAPSEVAAIAILGEARQVEVRDSIVYVTNDSSNFLIFDVSELTAIVERGSHTLCCVRRESVDLRVIGDEAYLADRYGEVHVVDVGDPDDPRALAVLGGTGATSDFELVGRRAYLGRAFGIELWDLTDLAQPVRIGALRLPGDVRDVEVVGSRAFVAIDDAGLRVVDLADPSRPAVLGELDLPGSPSPDRRGFALADGLAYVPDGNALRVLDVSRADEPRELSSIDGGRGGDFLDVELSGTTAYTAEGGWFTSLDVSTPEEPSLLDVRSVQCGSSDCGQFLDVEIVDGRAYLAAGIDGLRILDVSNPRALSPLGQFATFAQDAEIIGQRAWVTTGTNFFFGVGFPAVEVLDVSDPSQPERIGFADEFGEANAVDVVGDRVYVATPQGLKIFDSSDLGEITSLGTVSLPGTPRDVEVSNGLAYVSTGIVWVVDVSDAQAPFVLGGIGSGSSDLELAGTLVYTTTANRPFSEPAAFQIIEFGPQFVALPEPNAALLQLAALIALFSLALCRRGD